MHACVLLDPAVVFVLQQIKKSVTHVYVINYV